MKIVVGSDHAGFTLKEKIKGFLASLGIQTLDVGAPSADSVDYPDYAEIAAKALLGGSGDLGILTCGTGIGICIAANKVRGIRAVAPWNPDIARLTRQHNDANILCLSGRYMDHDYALELVKVWIDVPFERGGRHERRVHKILELEQRF